MARLGRVVGLETHEGPMTARPNWPRALRDWTEARYVPISPEGSGARQLC